MNVTETTENGVPVLQPAGRLDTNTSPEFERRLLDSLKRAGNVVVDLAELEYVSSAGLRVVLIGAKHAKQAGGIMVLCGFRDAIRQVFEISGFLKILTAADSRDEAIALIQQPR